MTLEDGPVYTLKQVSAARWLGPLSPEAIRKACNEGVFVYRLIRRKLGMTKADILANQEASIVPPKTDRGPSPARSGQRIRADSPEVPPGVTRLVAAPERARRTRAS